VGARRENGEGTAPRERADGRWEIRVRYIDPLTSMPARRSLYGRTKTETRGRLKDFQARLDSGESARDARMTLNAWIERWLATTRKAANVTVTTRNLDSRMLRLHVGPEPLGQMAIGEIRASHINAWLNAKRDDTQRQLSERSIERAYQSLTSCFKDAVTEGLILRNPCAVAKRPRPTKLPREAFSADELRAFLRAAQQCDDRLYPMWHLIAVTGLRKGEALSRSWDRVDLERSTLKVLTSTTEADGGGFTIGLPKTQSGRRELPLPARAVEVLRAHRIRQIEERLRAADAWVETGLVFTTPLGTMIGPRSGLHFFHKTRRLAGIPDERKLVIHSLRHAVATSLLENGLHARAVADTLGHADPSTLLRIYAHTTTSVALSAMVELSEALDERLGHARGHRG